MPTPLLALDHVAVRHLNRVLFADLSLRIEPGQHWALVGPSGAGKSALLAALAGQLLLTGGAAAYPGLSAAARQRHPADPLAAWRQVVSLVGARAPFRARPGGGELYYQQRYEATAAEEVPTVREHLLAQPARPGGAWTYARVVARLRLGHLLGQPLIQLSNGETKRLRLATALLRHPALLLLDNPLAGLDVDSRADFDALLAEIAAAGTTVVLATAPGEIPALVTHVAELAAGQLVRTGPVAAYRPLAPPAPPVPDAAALHALWPATPPAFTTLAKLEDVTIRYGERVILDRLSWEIRPGERWALLGPNGAGKSTVISLLNGDNPQAYSQRITLFDRRRGTGESIWDIKRRIGYVSPELLQYFPGQPTCLGVVVSGFADTLGAGRPTPAQLATARAWLGVLHLADYTALPLRQVPASAQRLCLVARALVKNPPLLLLDEPGQGLDATQQPYFRAVLEAICTASPVALVYVSHYAADIPRSVTRVLRLGEAPAG
ncbi:ATP-binding cassette domain-containing protein [Hymenobacter cheonanensis]|uniref:ATP-binding cassette domain-containing protein n=1 Tax=Hymenobacter sp. CA2-7 TaxID=3063993 RepID=UPI0027135047|nr:ATP-binding cassette domain-containing protein [Hymenobacter sp. CA2-7]MDO7887203.1 ATP-binding cassette domain-containing protein [Hymenobacter sp. CA2-7]